MTTSLPTNAAAPSKGASNRLLTMKFMQKSVTTSSQSKLQKGGHSREHAERIQADKIHLAAVLAGEEAKREAALMTTAAKEERWQLAFAGGPPSTRKKHDGEVVGGVRILVAGPGHERSSSDDDESPPTMKAPGKRYFGGRQKEKPKDTDGAETDTSDSESNSNSDTEVHARKQALRQLKKEEKQKKSLKDGDGSVRKLTSISNGGNAARGPNMNVTCFKCGKVGHIKAECPQQGGGGSRKRAADGEYSRDRMDSKKMRN